MTFSVRQSAPKSAPTVLETTPRIRTETAVGGARRGPSIIVAIFSLAALTVTIQLAAPTTLAAAGNKEKAAKKKTISEPWTVDDLVEHEALGAVALSHDGSAAAWVKTTVHDGEEGPKRFGQLFWADLRTENDPIALTHGRERFGPIAFSPDGRYLAFVSNRKPNDGESKEAQSHLWLLPLRGGEARALTKGEIGVDDFRWIDPQNLLFSRSEEPTLRNRRLEEGHDEAFAVDDVRDNPPQRLFRVSLDGEARRLTLDSDWIEEMAVSPDGSKAVVSAAQSTRYAFDAKIPPKTFLVNLETGERQQILNESGLLPRSFAWANADSFYFIDDFTHHPIYRQATVAHLYRFDIGSGSARRVEHGMERGIGRGFEVVPDGIVALMADGTRFAAAHLAGDRASLLETPADHRDHLDSLWASRDGSRIVYVRSAADESPQLWTASLTTTGWSEARRLTRLNESHDLKPRGKTEIVRWTGAEGDTVEGVLSYPFDWQEGKRYPLVLDIHGGPTGYDRHSWDSNWASPTPLWRQRGAFVFRVNYHGSGNYGLEWAESIRERYYELEVPDIESGVDTLIERGLVDPDRMATTGWSNGGILSAALIVHTNRYKAAIVGAADVEWISDWGNVDFGAAFDNYYFGGPPWKKLQHYIEKSPFFSVESITTPTLLHTGTEDRNVPPHQSWSMFRAMQFVEKTETRLVLYPGEPHGLRDIPHQKRKIREDLEWLDRHLFGHETSRSPIEADSALASRLARRTAATVDDGRLGELAASTLVPETIDFGGLRVGRFEVTVDQWREFAAQTDDIDPLTTLDDGNLPAKGVSAEDAQRYVSWLSEETGRSFALPTVSELEQIGSVGRSSSDGSANTLNVWLSSASSPDDRATILQHLNSRGAHLLKPVGVSDSRFLGLGGDTGRIFDLDGNVAEWAINEDGKLQAVGDSADRNPGSKLDVDPGYIGLRVVIRP